MLVVKSTECRVKSTVAVMMKVEYCLFALTCGSAVLRLFVSKLDSDRQLVRTSPNGSLGFSFLSMLQKMVFAKMKQRRKESKLKFIDWNSC